MKLGVCFLEELVRLHRFGFAFLDSELFALFFGKIFETLEQTFRQGCSRVTIKLQKLSLDVFDRSLVYDRDMKLTRVDYARLNARQKENFNFQKVSAVLAEYGFVTFRLSDDWAGADFIALHVSGEVLRVQLKSRLAFYEKYEGKNLHVAFSDHNDWYLYPHDEVLTEILKTTTMGASSSWQSGGYSFAGLSPKIRKTLEPYRISGDTKPLSTGEDETPIGTPQELLEP